MRKPVAIAIVGIAIVAVVAYFLRSRPPDSEEKSVEATVNPVSAPRAQPQTRDDGTRTANTDTQHAGALPSRRERPDDICDELSTRRMAREQAARDAEPKDSAWAYPMEQKLRDYTSSRFQSTQIQANAIDCKTTFCEITAESFAPEMSGDFSDAMSAATQQSWNDFTGISISNDTESGKRLHYARLTRKQSAAAVREEVDEVQQAVLRSEEQALASCSALVQEQQDRERAAREAELRDANWADPMEQLLRQHIETQLRKHPLERLEITCRATFCKLKASGQKLEARLAFQKAAQEVGSEPWANLRSGDGGGSGYGDSWKEEWTLYRQ